MTQARLRQLLALAAVLGATLLASRGIFLAIAQDKLMSGHDASGYAIYVTEFHDNIAHGNLAPVWAQHLRFGYGEPHLEFRPPLESYTAELFFALTGNIFLALNLTCFVFLLSAAAGMYFLCRQLLNAIASAGEPQATAEWAPAFAAAAFVLSPYVLVDTYVRGAYSEASSFSILPWLAYAFLRLAQQPTSKRLAAAALAYAVFAMSHAAIHLFTLPFFIATIVYYRRQIKKTGNIFLAVALGLTASCFYWLTGVVEAKFVKIPLMLVDFEAYVGHFIRLDEMVHTNILTSPGGLNFAVGYLTLFGLGFFIWRWASGRQLPTEAWRLVRLLAIFCFVCTYFMHRISALWYELFPPLQIMSFPWRFLTIYTFFGCLLGTLALVMVSRSPRTLAIAAVFLVTYGALKAAPLGYQNYPASTFSPNSIVVTGMGWAKPQLTPSTSGVIPTQRADTAVQVAQGRAELSCDRQGPTVMECEVMAIQTTTLRFNILHYEGWRATVDAQPASISRIEPMTGTSLVTIPPGKHVVRWQLHDTGVRATTKALAFLSWLAIAVLLFQDQLIKGKALLPKRKQRGEERAPA